jgi:hypothetical protein
MREMAELKAQQLAIEMAALKPWSADSEPGED